MYLNTEVEGCQMANLCQQYLVQNHRLVFQPTKITNGICTDIWHLGIEPTNFSGDFDPQFFAASAGVSITSAFFEEWN